MPEKLPTVGTREHRFVAIAEAPVEVRAAAEDQPETIEGYGALYERETVIGSWFREVIAKGAFKETVANDDIRVAFNHSPMAILGRSSAKTATITDDDKGLKYVATPPDTQAGRDTVTSIKRGDVTGSSFQFEIESSDDVEWDFSQTKDGMLPLRRIKRAKVWETGPVAFPAYEDTTASVRSQMDDARAQWEARQAAAAAPPPEQVAGALETELLGLDLDLQEIE